MTIHLLIESRLLSGYNTHLSKKRLRTLIARIILKWSLLPSLPFKNGIMPIPVKIDSKAVINFFGYSQVLFNPFMHNVAKYFKNLAV